MFKILNSLFNKNTNQSNQSTSESSTNDREVITESVTDTSKISTVPKHSYFTFRVAGITKENDEKKDIQTSLQRFARKYCKENDIPFFGGYTAKEIKEEFLLMDGVREFEDLVFTNTQVTFVPEPDNPYDKNAIKVYVDFDFEQLHIGYVPKKLTKELMDIINNKKVNAFSGEIAGGKIKVAEEDEFDGKEKVVTKELTLGFEISIQYF